MNLDYFAEFDRFSRLLDKGLAELRAAAQDYAQKEADYRKARRVAWAKCPTSPNRSEWTNDQRLDWVKAETADLRQLRDLANDNRWNIINAIESRRAQISALQSLLKLDVEEASFARTGPRMEP